MRRALPCFAACLLLCFSLSCGRSKTASGDRNDDAYTAAGRLGQAAHKLAKQADKAAESMGKNLKRAAHDAHEGWKEEDRKSREKALQGK